MKFDVSGEPIHTRCLAIAFSQGAGHSVTFRADILDLRKSGLMELAGRITMAGIIHKMELHGSFDADSGALERITWDQSHVMHEPNRSSRGECCRDPMQRLTGLVGCRLGQGFVADLKSRFGGPLGCTHVNTLFQEVSAFVSRLQGMRERDENFHGVRVAGERLASRSVFFDAFFAAGDASGETSGQISRQSAATGLSVRLADLFYAPVGEQGREVMLQHDEARVRADVDLAGWQIRSMRARERSRTGPACQDDTWIDRSDELEDFTGQSLGGGMARLCLERFGSKVTDACLLSGLLCLGPGMTQVGAAVSNTLAPATGARPVGTGLPGPGPCYLLRAGGPLMESMRVSEDTDPEPKAG